MQKHLEYKTNFNRATVRFVVFMLLAGVGLFLALRVSDLQRAADLPALIPLAVAFFWTLYAYSLYRRDRLEAAMVHLVMTSSVALFLTSLVFSFNDSFIFWLMQAGMLTAAGAILKPHVMLKLVLFSVLLMLGCYFLELFSLNLKYAYGPYAKGFFAFLALSLVMGVLGYQSVRFSELFETSINSLERTGDRLREVAAQQEKTASQLLASEDRYRLLLKHTPVGLIRFDAELKVTYNNTLLLELLGLKKNEATDLDLTGIVPPSILRMFHEALTGQQGHFEGRHTNSSDGRQWWLDLFCAPVKDDNDVIVGGVAVIRDDSERRKRELELSITRDQAEKASEAKNRFLALMSHEIRTPMNGVFLSAQLLEDKRLGEEKRQSVVTAILYSSRLLMNLLDDILESSKLEAGLIDLVEKRFEPSALLKEMVELFKPAAEGENLSLYGAWVGDDPGYLLGDSARIRQMLSNLIGNAIKYTPSGFIQVQVEVLTANDDKVSLKFSVTDSGVGISKESQITLFEPFNRSQDERAQGVDGTGLGLSLVRQLASLMNGQAGVSSVPNEGSTFWFVINLKRDQRDPWDDGSDDDELDDFEYTVIENRTNNVSTNMTTKTFNPADHSILLVEDNITNAQLVQDMLELEGYTVHHAMHGQEALDLLYEKCVKVDAVLMDCRMPVMDGYECTQKIRAHEAENPSAGHLPIVALTANVFDDDRKRCMDVGMDDFMRKPVDLNELFKTLAALASGSRA